MHLAREIERLKRRQRAIPFIDPIDVRYSRFSPVLVPRAKAVMFCLMDVSASMGEREKELAKRFFILLHLFLKRKYERVDIVFIRHTHEAAEVDEQEFFYGRETGGTVVSSALKEMIADPRGALSGRRTGTSTAPRPPTATIPAATRANASPCCRRRSCRSPSTTPISRSPTRASSARRQRARNCGAATRALKEAAQNFAMARVADRADIYPVFRKLFAKQTAKGAAP